MVMERVTFFMPKDDLKALIALNKRLNQKHDSETNLSARIRIILRKYVEANKL
jgi:hypothetical protein